MLNHRVTNSLGALLGVTGLALFAKGAPQALQQGVGARVAQRVLTPEQVEILRHLSLVDLPDGQGGTNRTLRITGVNVQIVNGLGATNGFVPDPNSVDAAETQVNGLGNLIVGYDEAPLFVGDKTGSHNLVIGSYNSYLEFGGIVAGRFNRMESPFGAVVGGASNVVRGGISPAIVGGVENFASGDHAVASGGTGGEALGDGSTVMGGQLCQASGHYASILGGFRNSASGFNATMTGGFFNVAAGTTSSVSGGANRSASGENDWAAGSLHEDD